MRPPSNLSRVPVRVAVAVAASAIAVGGVAFAAVRAAGSADFTSAIVAMHSDKCLTSVPGHRHGNRLLQRGCTGAATQRFEFRRTGSGTSTGGARYEIRDTGSGHCVDVAAAVRLDGAPLIGWADCHGHGNQRFTLRPAAGFPGAFMLVADHSGKCADVRGASQDDGAPVVQWSCGDPATAGNEIWKVAVPSGAGPLPSTPGTGSATAAGTNPAWGLSTPPAGAPSSRAYRAIVTDNAHGYHPRDGECSREIHARYWAWGADGKVYPTWHPPRDPSGCTFGHEHGEDPRTSRLFAEVGWTPFGFANEQLAPSDPASQRDEDHVGHKMGAADGIQVHASSDPASPVVASCDALQMMHQGLHSPDAFTNNLHQMSYNVRCAYADDGTSIETRFTALVPIGRPGGFDVAEQCADGGARRHDDVGRVTPADSPTGIGDRFIADSVCADDIVAGNGDINRINEIWVYGATAPRDAGRLRRFEIATFLFSSNPARYFDPDAPHRTGHTVDLCYRGAKGFQCDQVRRLADQSGRKVTFDDPRSPFNGAARLMSPDHLVIQNEGPTTVYTDVFGERFSTTEFPGAIRQYIAGNHAFDEHQGPINGQFRNYAANATDRIHAPN